MDDPLVGAGFTPGGEDAARPGLLLFDVNETLSDMTPMAGRFEDVGAPGHLAKTWFAGLLRDGFALTVAGVNEPFARLAEQALRTSLARAPLTGSLDDAVAHVMDGFARLRVHEDVPPGIRALHDLGIRLVTLSNGSASVARRLLDDAGLVEYVEDCLSVEDAGVWKPGAGAYAYALGRCGVEPGEAMLVAVHPWDTDGAQRSGLRGAWVNRGEAPFPGYFLPPDLEVGSLVDLAARLG